VKPIPSPKLTFRIIGLAMRVHTRLGPGLFESAYTADIIVDDEVIVELKSVDRLTPLHHAQLLTYLRISGFRLGLLLNFNTVSLTKGIRRCIV